MLSRRLGLIACLLVCAVYAENAAENAAEKKPADTFTEEQRAAIGKTQETHQFQAEVSRLMDILINSLYSNREIFIRELVSNAADALDKVRFLALTDPSIIKTNENLEIKVKFDKDKKTITITDAGVGMSKDELIKNLGIVAKSGTTEFLEASASGADSLSLIGQFGVGFYSVYLVADKVTVISKANGHEQYIWESKADSAFTIAKDPRGDTLGRGTSIILHLKEDAEEFLDEALLTKLITRYSQFINFPISMRSLKQVDKEIELTPEELAAQEGEKEEKPEGEEEDLEVSEEEEETKKTTKTVKETVEEWKKINEAKPIWTKNPKDVSDQEYEDFYKSLTKDSMGPLEKIHFVAEGEITFRAILYIPKKADPQIYDKFYEKSTGLKLYVRRVLISDEFDDFLPRYLNFIKGIVDSDDLPLNVSRETLAQSRVLKVMSKKLTRKVLEMLRKIADRGGEGGDDDEDQDKEEKEEKEEKGEKGDNEAGDSADYDTFWTEYSKSIKMGVMDDKKNKSKLIKLLRFKSSKSDGKWTTFEAYVDRMKEDQNKIYFLTCENMKQCLENPILEKFVKKGIEVLYMDEAIDEYCSQHIHEFDGIEPANIIREGSQLGHESKAFKAYTSSEDIAELTKWFTKVLGDKVAKVFVSNKLVDSPAVCSAPEYGWTGNMERIMRAQALQSAQDIKSQIPKKNFEYNPFHPIIKEINRKRKDNPDDETLKDLANILFESASIVSGYTSMEPENFAKRIHKIVALGLDIDPDAKAADEVEVEEESEPKKEEVANEGAEEPAEEEDA